MSSDPNCPTHSQYHQALYYTGHPPGYREPEGMMCAVCHDEPIKPDTDAADYHLCLGCHETEYLTSL